MTQKQLLMHALAFAESPYRKDTVKMKAARAICAIAWLRHMNWRPEADALKAKLHLTDGLAETVNELREISGRTDESDSIASFLNQIYGWGLETGEWQATEGAGLVEELWALINMPS
jgi:hypothetical protein